MLDSRYLYLHEALGLGPMWLSQHAHLHPAQTTVADIEEATNKAPKYPAQTAQLKPEAQQSQSKQQKNIPLKPSISKQHNHLTVLQTISHNSDRKTHSEITTNKPELETKIPNSFGIFPQNNLSFSEIPASIAACTRCSLHQERCAPISGHGPKNARLLIISPNPAPLDDSSQQLFSGEVGKLLNNMLAAINIGIEETFYTSQVKCTPNVSLQITTEHIQACMPYLNAQINHIQPQAILLLGQIFSQLEQQKLAQNLNNIPYVIAPHPARLLRQSHLKATAWIALRTLRTYLHKN